MSDAHKEHWQEPAAVTEERPKTDIYCEFCGEDIPWHNSSCSMLKNAYKRRYGKCHFCKKPFLVGDTMADHVRQEHAEELAVLTGKKS